jgi:hypothetical protein
MSEKLWMYFRVETWNIAASERFRVATWFTELARKMAETYGTQVTVTVDSAEEAPEFLHALASGGWARQRDTCGDYSIVIESPPRLSVYLTPAEREALKLTNVICDDGIAALSKIRAALKADDDAAQES